MNSYIYILKNKYLPFLFAVPLFFGVFRYDGVVFDAILYVTQYIYSIDPSRFLGDPAFIFGNQDSLGFFSPILGFFLECFGVAKGAFVYTFLMHLGWILAVVCLVKSLLSFTRQRFWILPVTILLVFFFAHGMAFSKIQFFNYASTYACSRSLSIVLGMGALALIFFQKRLLSLLFIVVGTVIHPLTAGWCFPFWLFYFFPITRFPVVLVSLFFPLSCFFHVGVFDFISKDWLERPLEFVPDYMFFSKAFVLLSFFGILAKWSFDERIRKISFSLFLLMAIAFYWNIWGGIGEHVFLYQVQPWRAAWVPSIIAAPLGLCVVKDLFRKCIKKKYFTTHDLGLVILIVSFLAPTNLIICSVSAIVLFLKRPIKISLKGLTLTFVVFYVIEYLIQQYFTWCLQGFPSFWGFDYLKLCRIRDSLLLYQLFFTIAFAVIFFKKKNVILAALMLASIFLSRFMLLPILPLFMFFCSKENRLKYWGGMIAIACLIVFDGLFDADARRMTLIDGMPLKFPKICFTTATFFLFLYLSKKKLFWGLGVWFAVCCVVSFVNYSTGFSLLKKESQLDRYFHEPIFPQITERGKILFDVSGDYESEPRLQFFSGTYLSKSSIVGGLFNRKHFRMTLERSHLLYKKSMDSESLKYYTYGEIINKLADTDTLIDRTDFLCGRKEISHLVTDRLSLPFVKEDSAMVRNNQKVFLYGCPSAD